MHFYCSAVVSCLLDSSVHCYGGDGYVYAFAAAYSEHSDGECAACVTFVWAYVV